MDMSPYITDALNLDRLVQVRDVIATDPEHHSQASYESWMGNECGTSRCVAGWTTHLMGLSKDEILEGIGGYDEVAAKELGIRSWDSAHSRNSLLTEQDSFYDGHPFSAQYSHDETLRNLDSLIALAKDQEDTRSL